MQKILCTMCVKCITVLLKLNTWLKPTVKLYKDWLCIAISPQRKPKFSFVSWFVKTGLVKQINGTWTAIDSNWHNIIIKRYVAFPICYDVKQLLTTLNKHSEFPPFPRTRCRILFFSFLICMQTNLINLKIHK